MWYGIGSTGAPNPAAAFIEVLPDATVNVMTGCAEIGQGSTTVLAQIAAEELGLRYEDIFVTAADTGVTPESGPTGASRQTLISGNAVRNAAKNAKKELLKVAANVLAVPEEDLVFKNREIYSGKDGTIRLKYTDLMREMVKRGQIVVAAGTYNPKTHLDPSVMKGEPYESYAYATAIAEVEVDTATGCITLLNVVSAHDAGFAINPNMLEGQIEGGVVMGQGFALLEKTECVDGVIMNPNYSKYLIPTAMDIPDIYPVIVEDPCAAGPFGAKGVAEPALIPVIPAIIDAVEDAIGIRFIDLPITPTDVMRELKKKESLC